MASNKSVDFPQGQLNEKEIMRMEIQVLLDQFYTKQNQLAQNENTNWLVHSNNLFSPINFCNPSIIRQLICQVSDGYILIDSDVLNEAIHQNVLRELQEERCEKVCINHSTLLFT